MMGFLNTGVPVKILHVGVGLPEYKSPNNNTLYVGDGVPE